MNLFMRDGRYDDTVLGRVQQLQPIAADLGLTLAQLSLAWVLREPNVAAPIIGATRPEQVEENAGASGVQLDRQTLDRIDEILADSVVYEGPES
jgi:aryl-alcohol dehydrogenase-like predicted oxidoreductase